MSTFQLYIVQMLTRSRDWSLPEKNVVTTLSWLCTSLWAGCWVSGRHTVFSFVGGLLFCLMTCTNPGRTVFVCGGALLGFCLARAFLMDGRIRREQTPPGRLLYFRLTKHRLKYPQGDFRWFDLAPYRVSYIFHIFTTISMAWHYFSRNFPNAFFFLQSWWYTCWVTVPSHHSKGKFDIFQPSDKWPDYRSQNYVWLHRLNGKPSTFASFGQALTSIFTSDQGISA